MIVEWSSDDPSYKAPAELFLSRKTRTRLTPGAVGDLMKMAFGEAKVEGNRSLHSCDSGFVQSQNRRQKLNLPK
jgi:hypothetical protein